jgi:hypothetical protein
VSLGKVARAVRGRGGSHRVRRAGGAGGGGGGGVVGAGVANKSKGIGIHRRALARSIQLIRKHRSVAAAVVLVVPIVNSLFS